MYCYGTHSNDWYPGAPRAPEAASADSGGAADALNLNGAQFPDCLGAGTGAGGDLPEKGPTRSVEAETEACPLAPDDKVWLESFYELAAYDHFKELADRSTFYSVTAAGFNEEGSPLMSLKALAAEPQAGANMDGLRAELLGPDGGLSMDLETFAAIEVECGPADSGAVQLELEDDDVGCQASVRDARGKHEQATASASYYAQKFFRVVAKSPGSLKRPRTDVDIRIPGQYTAVVQHKILNVDRKGLRVLVELRGASDMQGSAETAMLMSSTGASHTLVRWSRHEGLLYTSGLAEQEEFAEGPGCSAALEACISAGAWDGEGALELDMRVAEHTGLEKSLQQLCEKGIVACTVQGEHRQSYQITKAGGSSLHCGISLHSPVKASMPRDGIPVSDMTSWELIQHLEGCGWQARVATSPRGLESFKVHRASRKIFWFRRSTKTPCRPYLLVLASSSRLRAHGVQEVPHLKAATVYLDMLQSLGMTRVKPRAGSGPLMKLDDDDGTVAPLAGSEEAIKRGQRRGGGRSTGARNGDRQAANLAENKITRRRQERSYEWGPHGMIFKPPVTWQATCCRRSSHVKPDTPGTICTRSMSYKGPDNGLEDLKVQRALKRWLNMCMDFPTRAGHMGVAKAALLQDLPEEEDLATACLSADYNSDREQQIAAASASIPALRRRRWHRGAGASLPEPGPAGPADANTAQPLADASRAPADANGEELSEDATSSSSESESASDSSSDGLADTSGSSGSWKNSSSIVSTEIAPALLSPPTSFLPLAGHPPPSLKEECVAWGSPPSLPPR